MAYLEKKPAFAKAGFFVGMGGGAENPRNLNYFYYPFLSIYHLFHNPAIAPEVCLQL